MHNGAFGWLMTILDDQPTYVSVRRSCRALAFVSRVE